MTTTELEKPQVNSDSTAIPPVKDPLFQLRDVVKIYTTGSGGFTALSDINLDIFQGEFLGITGKSGAGKTTLLNMISGVSSITSGEVLFTNHQNGSSKNGYEKLAVHNITENELALWRGRNLGIVYQSFELLPQMDLVSNIMIPLDFTGSFRPINSRDKAVELLDLVELSEHANKKPSQISGGQKQRVAIARALVNDPPVILADEPTGNLDTVTAETILQIFERLVGEGKTIVMVTHDTSLVTRFSRWVQISDGEIVENSTSKLAEIILSQSTPSDAAYTNASGGNGNSPVKDDQYQPIFDDPPGVHPEIPGTPEHDPTNADISILEPATVFQGLSDMQSGAADTDPAVVLRDVTKTYRNAAGEFPALKGINLQMKYGQFISIVGKSGSGKSTLLNMLTGIDHPTSGEVVIGGKRIYEMSESQRALWRGKNVGIVFQFFQLLPTLTLLENTMLPMDYCNIYRTQDRQVKAMDLLKMVGLEDFASKLPGAVSSGQQQSAAIARALATDPPIIVADEPTGNLDSHSADTILTLFKELAARGKTILLVTHDPSFTKRTQQTVILSDGEIIDDVVARALPLLDHPQMLAATHQAKTRRYAPGKTIIRQGEPVENFFMIRSGEVDIILSSTDCHEMCLARLGPGQFFGEVELTKGVNSVASARAAVGGPVELALLDKGDFVDLLNSSSSTERAITDVAQVRMRENRTRGKDCAER